MAVGPRKAVRDEARARYACWEMFTPRDASIASLMGGCYGNVEHMKNEYGIDVSAIDDLSNRIAKAGKDYAVSERMIVSRLHILSGLIDDAWDGAIVATADWETAELEGRDV